jgi:hypothetical protein
MAECKDGVFKRHKNGILCLVKAPFHPIKTQSNTTLTRGLILKISQNSSSKLSEKLIGHLILNQNSHNIKNLRTSCTNDPKSTITLVAATGFNCFRYFSDFLQKTHHSPCAGIMDISGINMMPQANCL